MGGRVSVWLREEFNSIPPLPLQAARLFFTSLEIKSNLAPEKDDSQRRALPLKQKRSGTG